MLENDGFIDLKFWICDPNVSKIEYLEIHPMSGLLKSKEFIKFEINYCPRLSGFQTKEILLKINNIEPISITLKTYGLIPKIDFSLTESLRWNNADNEYNYKIISNLTFPAVNIETDRFNEWEIIQSDVSFYYLQLTKSIN